MITSIGSCIYFSQIPIIFCIFAIGKIVFMMNESFVIQSDIANIPYVEERVFHFCRECNVGNYYSAVSVAVL